MKHRKTHLGLSLKVISILSCVAILAVGFANWWIIKVNNPTPEVTGSFEVYTVEEKEITIRSSITNANIIYGIPENYGSITSKWLVANNVGSGNGQMKTENLQATLTITVSADSGIALNSILDTLTITLASNANLNSVAPENVAAPKIYKDSVADANLKATYDETKGATITVSNAELGSSNTVTLTYIIQFGWGSITNGQNPYAYYNSSTNGFTYETKGTEAFNLLTAVNGLNGNSYKLTIASQTK